jgi:hypothetical protein
MPFKKYSQGYNFQKVGQSSRSQYNYNKYVKDNGQGHNAISTETPQKSLVTENTPEKYQSPSAYKSIDIPMVTVFKT